MKICPKCRVRYDASERFCSVDSEVLVADSSMLVGTTLDGIYVLESLLGEGAMGAVYRAKHIALGDTVAIKLLKLPSDDGQWLRRFQREGRAARRLRHPNVVTVHDLRVTSDGIAYLVLEYVDGCTLRQELRTGRMQFARVLRLLEPLAKALDAGHRSGVVHRDLKPDNVMIVRGGDGESDVKLLDLGIAKLIGVDELDVAPASMLTIAGQILGTPHYMSPEQWGEIPSDGIAEIDGRADVYSLAVMTFELLTGTWPIRGLDVHAVRAGHLSGSVASVRDVVFDLPPDVDVVIRRGMALDRRDRYPTSIAFVEALADIAMTHPKLSTQDDVPTQGNPRLADEPTVLLSRKGPAEPGDGRQLPSGLTSVWAGDGTLPHAINSELTDPSLPDRPACVADQAVDSQSLQLASSAVANNLPCPVTTLFGHIERIGRLVEGLTMTRLTTVAGPAGVGKTRIAIATAQEVLTSYPDGVWLVELAPIADPALVASAVANAVGVSEEPERTIQQSLCQALEKSRMLLLLDNCEHVIDSVAALVAGLLRSSASVHVLATSREPLGVDGEVVETMTTMEVPDGDEAAALSDAVRLFLDRARISKHGFAPSKEAVRTIARICRRLDGLPLAIELAAARVRMISPEQILSRLDDRFALLSSQGRSGEPRKQTLRAALDWSYALLADQERALLDAVSVFAGSFSLEGAEAVAPERANVCDVLDDLTRLVNKSLVTVEDEGEDVRYRLLESIRQYGREKLDASGRAPDTLARLHAWAVDLAASYTSLFNTPERTALRPRFDLEHDNLRAALRWSLRENPEAHRAVALVHGLWRYWLERGHLTEGIGYVREALALQGESDPSMLADVLRGGGDLAYSMGFLEDSERYLQDALAAFRTAGDRRGAGLVMQRLADVAQCMGRSDEALALCEESLEIAREVGDRLVLALALSALGVVAMDREEYGRATAVLEETLDLSREIEYPRGVCAALHNLGDIAERLGDLERAESMLEECRAVSLERSDFRMTAYTLGVLGRVARRRGDYATAQARLCEALRMHNEVNDRVGVVCDVEVLAAVMVGQGHSEFAIELLGAASSIRKAVQVPLPPVEKTLVDETLAVARGAISPDAADRAFMRGRRLSADATVTRMLSFVKRIAGATDITSVVD